MFSTSPPITLFLFFQSSRIRQQLWAELLTQTSKHAQMNTFVKSTAEISWRDQVPFSWGYRRSEWRMIHGSTSASSAPSGYYRHTHFPTTLQFHGCLLSQINRTSLSLLLPFSRYAPYLWGTHET